MSCQRRPYTDDHSPKIYIFLIQISLCCSASLLLKEVSEVWSGVYLTAIRLVYIEKCWSWKNTCMCVTGWLWIIAFSLILTSNRSSKVLVIFYHRQARFLRDILAEAECYKYSGERQASRSLKMLTWNVPV